MPTIEQHYMIAGSPQDVWDALTDPDRIRQWSGADAQFKAEAGAEYSLWAGDIRGRVLEVEPRKRLVQSWRPGNYPDDSLVTFLLSPTEDGTEVWLTHENVPDWDSEATSQGWDTYYLGAIKKMIEGRLPQRQPDRKPRKRTANKASASKESANRRRPSVSRAAAPSRPKTTTKKSTAKSKSRANRGRKK